MVPVVLKMSLNTIQERKAAGNREIKHATRKEDSPKRRIFPLSLRIA
jgi:hypothetical protein